MTILVDMDDTMECLLDSWTEFLAAKYGVSVSRKDIKEWDMQKAYPTLSKEQIYAPLFGMLPNKILQMTAPMEFCKMHEWVPPCPACYGCCSQKANFAKSGFSQI